MKRRLISLLLICILLCPLLPAHAQTEEKWFKFLQTAVPAMRNWEVSVTWGRTHSGSGKGVLVIQDESGAMLGYNNISETSEVGTIRFIVPDDMPAAQTLYLYFYQDEQLYLQDTCLLASDSGVSDGLRKVETTEKKIAITFDSSNGLGKLPELLDTLDRLNIKCTFFLQGDFFNKNSAWAEEIHVRGHELANHSMHHPDMRDINNSRIHYEIATCNSLIEKITGKTGTLYRPPSGYYSYRDLFISRALGSESILWTFDSKDGFLDSTYEKILNIMYRRSEPGAIVLMHIYGIHTIAVLEAYIPVMQELGYEFVTVSDLMITDGVIDLNGVMHQP